ncbi:MAG TPA: hypothetical protein VMZ53_27505 [Kofleriaceae bacterium]|nr:hypothetical protein [Kofleriaceae bacterium]
MKAVLSYLLSLAGLGVSIWAVMGAALANLPYPKARLEIVNMLRTSVNKAQFLCKTAKNTFYEPIGEAIKIGAMAQTTDPNIIGMATKPGYDSGVSSVTQHWNALFSRGKKGVMLVAGGVALAIVAKTNPALHIIVAVLTAGAAVWFMMVKLENERSLVRAKAEILPEVDRGFAEGRYIAQ